MRKLSVLLTVAALVTGSTAARADFFDVLNKVNKVANTVDRTSRVIERVGGAAQPGGAEGAGPATAAPQKKSGTGKRSASRSRRKH